MCKNVWIVFAQRTDTTPTVCAVFRDDEEGEGEAEAQKLVEATEESLFNVSSWKIKKEVN